MQERISHRRCCFGGSCAPGICSIAAIHVYGLLKLDCDH